MSKKILTDEHKRKLSEAAKVSNATRVLSEETLAKMSASAKARPKREMSEKMIKRKEHVFVEGVESKECCKCHKTKPLSEYGKNSKARWDGLTYECKICRNELIKSRYRGGKRDYYMKYAVERRRAAKMRAVELKGGQCQKCGIKHDPEVNTSIFQFHHRDPDQKDFSISSVNMRSFDNITAELEKCDLLCANCHHILHWSLKKE